VVGVLEVQPHRTGRQQPLGQLVGRQAVAGLQVGRHGHVDRGGDAPHRLGHLGDRRALAVVEPERAGHAAARRGDRGQAGPRDGVRARRVPRVEEQQRVAGDVQAPQALGLRGELGHEAEATTS
jgi:hypothetical protein